MSLQALDIALSSYLWTFLPEKDLRHTWLAYFGGEEKSNNAQKTANQRNRWTLLTALACHKIKYLHRDIYSALIEHCKNKKLPVNSEWKVKVAKAVHIYLKAGSDTTRRLAAVLENQQVTDTLPVEILKRFSDSATNSTALITACEEGRKNAVLSELKKKAIWINVVDYWNHTPLSWACERGYAEIVKILIDGGADVNPLHTRCNSPLIEAASARLEHVDIVALLLDSGADVNTANNNGETALSKAAESGHEKTVNLLLQHDVDVNAADMWGRTALMKAARNGHIGVVKSLIEKKAAVDTTDGEGETAVMKASSRGHIKILSLLLDSGADVNTADNNGETAVMKAALRGWFETVRFLVEHNADINALDNNGQSALLRVAFLGVWDRFVTHERGYAFRQLDSVTVLLECGADPNLTDHDGNIALVKASWEAEAKTIEMLLRHKARVNATNNKGVTALMTAAGNRRIETIDVLLKYKADLNAATPKGVTALMFAVYFLGGKETVDHLLKKGADVNAKCSVGWTALMSAAWQGSADMVNCLLDHGAKTDVVAIDGNTAFSLAKSEDIRQALQTRSVNKRESGNPNVRSTTEGD